LDSEFFFSVTYKINFAGIKTPLANINPESVERFYIIEMDIWN